MHPEHFDLSCPLYLPITREACLAVLEAENTQDISALSDPELAAILALQNLAKLPEKELTAVTLERVLGKLIDWAASGQHCASVTLLSETLRLLDRGMLYFGTEAIKKIDVRFLEADEVASRNYLLVNGKWNHNYKYLYHKSRNPFIEQLVTPQHRERWLSSAQDKVVRVFQANTGEHLHIQGYAGIGKSHLLGAFLEYLKPEQTIVLAATPAKLSSILNRFGWSPEGLRAMTFKKFAYRLLHKHRVQASKSHPQELQSKVAVAQLLGISAWNGRDALQTIDMCLKIIERYCWSMDYTISPHHLPNVCNVFPKADTGALLEYASRLWVYIEENPTWVKASGLDTLIPVKLANLLSCVAPAYITHILIDESQETPPSLLRIIGRGKQVLITLGDEYQEAQGFQVNRKRDVRHTDVVHSVRSGYRVEQLINPLIHAHSKKGKNYFEGACDHDVTIEQYPTGFLPPAGCVVLTASKWDTVKWMLLLSRDNCPFGFIDHDAARDIMNFIANAIVLFNPKNHSDDKDNAAKHSDFVGFSNWKELRSLHQENEAFLWIEAELAKGFKFSDMNKLEIFIRPESDACVLVEANAVGGMEFHHVLLTPELLTTANFRNAEEFDRSICAAYIAISRAKQLLHLPYSLQEWLEYHQQQNYPREPEHQILLKQ